MQVRVMAKADISMPWLQKWRSLSHISHVILQAVFHEQSPFLASFRVKVDSYSLCR